jgi:hypothetical protein
MVLALAGCGTHQATERVTSARAVPAQISCDLPISHCSIAVFQGFPEFLDYEVMPIDTVEYCEAAYQDANLSTPDGIVNIASEGASAYTYQYPTTLFAGGKYPTFQSDLLCADIRFGGEAVFPNLGARSYIWHGDSINVQPEDRNVTARYKGWTAVFNEVIERPGYLEINAAHFLGPGRREVKLSHVEQTCQGG